MTSRVFFEAHNTQLDGLVLRDDWRLRHAPFVAGLAYARDGMLYLDDRGPVFRNDLFVNDDVSLRRGSTETT